MPLSNQNKADIDYRNKLIKNALEPSLRSLLINQYNKLDTLTKLDNAYKVLMDDLNNEIDLYNNELTKLDCITKPTVTENHILEAAKDTLNAHNNPLFHDNNGNYLNKFKTPFLGSVVIGLSSRVMPPTSNSNCSIYYRSTIAIDISNFNASGNNAQKATGETCTLGPAPGLLSIITPFFGQGTVSSMFTLKDTVLQYKSFLSSLKSQIYVSSGFSINNSQGEDFKNKIDITSSLIDDWLALPDFIPSSNLNGIPNGCAAFNALGFGNSKGNPTNIANLTSALNNQASYESNRITQLLSYLGTNSTVTQDSTWGIIPDNSPLETLYLERAILVNARVGRTNGSMRQKVAVQNEIEDQEQTLKSLYTSLSVANLF